MKKITLFLVLSLFFNYCIAQVGIGTVNPTAALDVQSTTGGLLAPRVSLTTTLLPAPVVNPQGGLLPAGTMVYNINTVADVTPGYYYWNGTIWVRMVGAAGSNDWSITGNAGTNSGTNFIGTTDNVGFRIRTNNTQQFEIGTNGRLRAFQNGSQTTPTYTFDDDRNTGMFLRNPDRLSFASGGFDLLQLNNNGTASVVINQDAEDVDMRVETENEANMLFIDGAEDKIGIKTDTPEEDLHLGGANSTIRIDGLNNVNNTNNETGISGNEVLTPVYVDGDGNLNLQAQGSLNKLVTNLDNSSFIPTAVAVNTTGPFNSGTLHTSTFTLYQDAIIDVNYTISVIISNRFGGTITDGAPRAYGTEAIVNGGSVTNEVILRQIQAFTNSATSGVYPSGYYYQNGSGMIELEGTPAGITYTITINGLVNGDSRNLRGTFGGSAALFNNLKIRASY